MVGALEHAARSYLQPWAASACSRHLTLPHRASLTRPASAAPFALPPPLQGLNNLAVVYTQQGRAQDALGLLQAALLAAPAYAEAHNNLGVLQVGVGKLTGWWMG